MELSIEKIWKEGFIDEKTLSSPTINDLTSLKSIYFIDKFKATYKTNIIMLIATAIIILTAFIFGGIPVIGFYMFILFVSLAAIGQFELNKLNEISFGDSNYQFIKAFDHWLKNLLSKFSVIYKFVIPLLFIGFALAILQTNLFIPFIGETLAEKFSSPYAYTIGSIPILWLSGIFALAIILSYFSNLIFKKEMKSIFGDTTARLEQLLTEIETLN